MTEMVTGASKLRESKILRIPLNAWAFIKEAPMLPTLILASVVFLAVFADLFPLH